MVSVLGSSARQQLDCRPPLGEIGALRFDPSLELDAIGNKETIEESTESSSTAAAGSSRSGPRFAQRRRRRTLGGEAFDGLQEEDDACLRRT